MLWQAANSLFRRFPLLISRLGRVWVRGKSYKILHRKKSRKHRKIRLKSKDFSRIWSECRDSNPRPLGPEGWSDIFSGHFEPFLRLSTRKISQRRPFRHGSFHLIFPRLGHGLGQTRKPAAQNLRRCKQRIAAFSHCCQRHSASGSFCVYAKIRRINT